MNDTIVKYCDGYDQYYGSAYRKIVMINIIVLINIIVIIVNQEFKAKVLDAPELALQLGKRVQRSDY